MNFKAQWKQENSYDCDLYAYNKRASFTCRKFFIKIEVQISIRRISQTFQQKMF